MSDERLKAAIEELSQKTLSVIQTETALTWAYRCRAAKILAKKLIADGDWERGLHYNSDAGEYGHEALEHAALAGDDDFLHHIREIMDLTLSW